MEKLERITTKADLHVHSKFSKRPSQWILKKLGCPESFTEPTELYRMSRDKGMSLFTITDHNSISGCLEIAHLPGTFISEEVTTYFPDDQCKIHVLVYDIDEARHRDIQALRENVFDLAAYLNREGIHHSMAHPLFQVNHQLTTERVEQALLLFRNFELNGSRGGEQNECLRAIVSGLKPHDIDRLADKHGIAPSFPEPWRKNLTGGSDDHSSLTVASMYTEVDGLRTPAEFLKRLDKGYARVRGRSSSPLILAHNLYSIAYQFYRNKLGLERHLSRDIFLKFLERTLRGGRDEEEGFLSRLQSLWSERKRARRSRPRSNRSLQDLLRSESRTLIEGDEELMEVVHGKDAATAQMEKKWFHFVNRLSNKTMLHFADHLFDHLSGANLFSVFHSLGSAGALYTMVAPYFVSYAVFGEQRRFTQEARERFAAVNGDGQAPVSVKVAHFTDTFYEVNGVARTLQQQAQHALKHNKDLTVITCGSENESAIPGVNNFKPIGVYEMPEYPEQKFFYPPFLEMLDYCYSENFSHIHSATPGPIGLSALAIARTLKLPIYGTYHTALPQYAQHLTNDSAIEDLMWKYVLWYYDQMDLILAPSRSTAEELQGRGISSEKIRLFPRGIDVELFTPSRRGSFLLDRYGLGDGVKLLYVGRVSREKNLPMLQRAFKRLVSLADSKVQLIVAGDGPYLNEMRESLKGTDSLFTGYIEGEDLASLYASSDLFVFPSATDTFGNVVLEAQASGIPVVVSDSGGPHENMIPGKTGVVVKADDEDEFLRAVASLVADRRRLREMGGAARRYMEERSFDKAFHQTWQLYGERSAAMDGDALAKAV